MLPFDAEEVDIFVSRHFRNTWMRKWDWDHADLREALRNPAKVVRVGKTKWEIFVRKKGPKKLVVIHDAENREIFVITGAEG